MPHAAQPGYRADRRFRLAAAATVMLLGTVFVLPPAAATATTTATATATAAAVPKVGDCWQYASYDAAVNSLVSPARKVPCSAPHNAVTTSVGVVRGAPANPWGANAEAVVAGSGLACDYRGYTSQQRLRLPIARPLRLEGDWYLPSKAQWAAGQRWTRCDTIIPNGSRLDTFPANLTRWAADVTASSRCYDADPAADQQVQVRRCNGNDTWKAVAWIPIPGSAFPGRTSIVALAQKKCAPLAARGKNWDSSFPRAINWTMGYRAIMCLVGGDGTVG